MTDEAETPEPETIPEPEVAPEPEPEDDTVPMDVDTVAREVLAGQWGRGNARKTKLVAAGHDPVAVEARMKSIINR